MRLEGRREVGVLVKGALDHDRFAWLGRSAPRHGADLRAVAARDRVLEGLRYALVDLRLEPVEAIARVVVLVDAEEDDPATRRAWLGALIAHGRALAMRDQVGRDDAPAGVLGRLH